MLGAKERMLMAIDIERFKNAAVSQGNMNLCVTACVFSVLNYIDYPSWSSMQKTDAYSYAKYLIALGADPRRILSGNCDLSEPFSFLKGYKVIRYSSDVEGESTEDYFTKRKCESADLWNNIEKHTSKGIPPILATRKCLGFHMVVILRVCGDIQYYDPSGTGVISEKKKDDILPQKDMRQEGGTGALHLVIEGRLE